MRQILSIKKRLIESGDDFVVKKCISFTLNDRLHFIFSVTVQKRVVYSVHYTNLQKLLKEG